MKGVLILIISFGFFLLLSCQYDPYADNYTTTQPTKESLIGTYRFETQTIDANMKDTCFSKSFIILYANMQFKSFNVPYFKEDSSYTYKYQGLILKQGKWDIETLGGVGNGWGREKPYWGIRLDSMPKELEFIGLLQNKAPYKLIISFGDPDAGDVIILSKYTDENENKIK